MTLNNLWVSFYFYYFHKFVNLNEYENHPEMFYNIVYNYFQSDAYPTSV